MLEVGSWDERYGTRTFLGKGESTPGSIAPPPRLLHPAYMSSSGPKHFLRPWRKLRKMTTYEVADAVGTTHATISRIETGKMPYNQHILEKLSDLYQVSVADLLATDPASPAGRAAAATGLDPDKAQRVAEYAEFLRSQEG